MIGFCGSFMMSNKPRFVLDSNPKEYGNKAPVIEKLKFDLQFNEAVLEYSNHNKLFYKIKA
jgi:hypothetical protein